MTNNLDEIPSEDQILQMLYYVRIDISKGNDYTKSNRSKEFMICHYFFFNNRVKLQDSVCHGYPNH